MTTKRKPNFTLPAGTCDAHCHVFGPQAKFPFAPERGYTPEDAPKEALAALHRHLGAEPFVIDHMGRIGGAGGTTSPGFRAMLELQKNERCWVKVCGAERNSATGAPYDDAVTLAAALVAGAADRVLWGTDWPHPNMT